MKKSDLDIQNENAILMAIAIADGYFPVDEKKYNLEFEKRMKNCGIDNYKEAFNHVYAGMPQYVGDDAIFSGKITLANKENDYFDFSLGNNEQYVDNYTNISEKIVSEFINNNLEYENVDANDILKDKYSMYNFLKKYVVPKLFNDRQEIASNQISDNNTLHDFESNNTINTLFDYKFSAFKHLEHSRGNRDAKYYSLTHGMLDAVIDLYDSLQKAYDEQDIDLRAISPLAHEELGFQISDDMQK